MYKEAKTTLAFLDKGDIVMNIQLLHDFLCGNTEFVVKEGCAKLQNPVSIQYTWAQYHQYEYVSIDSNHASIDYDTDTNTGINIINIWIGAPSQIVKSKQANMVFSSAKSQKNPLMESFQHSLDRCKHMLNSNQFVNTKGKKSTSGHGRPQNLKDGTKQLLLWCHHGVDLSSVQSIQSYSMACS